MWILYSFLSVVFLSSRTIVTKFNVAKTHEYIAMWYTFIFSIPIGLIVILLNGLSISDPKFFLLLPIRIILDIVAFIFLFKAFKLSKVSLLSPFTALLPVLVIFTSFIINGQQISLIKSIIIITIVITCYLLYKLNNQDSNKKIEENDKKGIFYIIITMGIYSIVDPLHAEILKTAAPFTYFFISALAFAVVWTIVVLIIKRRELIESFKFNKDFVFNASNGIILSLEVISLFLALSPGSITSIVSSIRSTNVAISSLLGGLIFKEKLNWKKILLILIIVVLLILLIIV